MDRNSLIDIANNLGLTAEAELLQDINRRNEQKDCELVLPLIGEFSSGKTTLINALTDSKKLETATVPTTATIFEIHFGAPNCHATIYKEDGTTEDVENIEDLHNDKIADSVVVHVSDTSKKVPSSIVLVDTPGLSSPIASHKQTLINFLPNADAILLVVDINQNVTKSLTDFVDTMNLAKCPLYLVITQCDTKSAEQIQQSKDYFVSNTKIPTKRVVAVSAKKDNLEELYTLLDEIKNEKNAILSKINAHREKQIAESIILHIDEILKATHSDEELMKAIRDKETELNRIKRAIQEFIDVVGSDCEEIEVATRRQFEDSISEKLLAIVSNKSENFDQEAVSAINTTASIFLQNYKTQVQQKIITTSNKEKYSLLGNLRSLKDIELNFIDSSVRNISYDLNLNSEGHKYDKIAANVCKVAAAAAVVYATAGVAAPAVASAGAAGTAASASTIISAADAATDVASIVMSHKVIKGMAKATKTVEKVQESLETLNRINDNLGQQTGQDKGMIESMVGFVSEKLEGKPQRKRAINTYLDSTLLPQFSQLLQQNRNQLLISVSSALEQDASETITERANILQQMKRQQEDGAKNIERRRKELTTFKKDIIANYK